MTEFDVRINPAESMDKLFCAQNITGRLTALAALDPNAKTHLHSPDSESSRTEINARTAIFPKDRSIKVLGPLTAQSLFSTSAFREKSLVLVHVR